MVKKSANNTKKTDYSDYCYRSLQDLINIGYSRELREGKTAPEGYPGWSPNNVRRIIISPDSVLVQYHITSGMRLNKNINSKVFDYEKALRCISSDKYAPMLDALKGTRVCSAVEEIVILTKSSVHSNLRLNNKELEIGSIGIKQSRDIVESLSRRYKRLYCISIIDRSLKDIIGDTAQEINKFKERGYLITDEFEDFTMDKVVVNKENWQTNKPNLQPLGRDGKGYIVDTEEGVLGKYFKWLIEKYKEDKKLELLKKFENRCTKEEQEVRRAYAQGLESELELLNVIINGYVSMEKVLKRERIKAILEKNLENIELLDKQVSELLEIYGMAKGYSSAMRTKLRAYTTYENIEKAIETIKLDIPKRNLNIIKKYYEGALPKDSDFGVVEIALNFTIIGLIEGIFNIFKDAIDCITEEKPKYISIILKKAKNHVFYECSDYAVMSSMSYLAGVSRSSGGVNSKILANNLGLVFTVFCEIYGVYGNKYTKMTSSEWKEYLLNGGKVK